MSVLVVLVVAFLFFVLVLALGFALLTFLVVGAIMRK
jgi:hypothetical protein